MSWRIAFENRNEALFINILSVWWPTVFTGTLVSGDPHPRRVGFIDPRELGRHGKIKQRGSERSSMFSVFDF